MNITELNDTLRVQAIELGLCQTWQTGWKNNWDKYKMIRRFFEGIDFCLAHQWPSLELIRENFPQDMLRSNGILIDDTFSHLNPKRLVLFGSSKSNIRYTLWNNGTCYICNNSRAVITAKTKAFVMVHAFGRAVINATATERAQVIIIRHSPNVCVQTSGNCKLREEYDYLK